MYSYINVSEVVVDSCYKNFYFKDPSLANIVKFQLKKAGIDSYVIHHEGRLYDAFDKPENIIKDILKCKN